MAKATVPSFHVTVLIAQYLIVCYTYKNGIFYIEVHDNFTYSSMTYHHDMNQSLAQWFSTFHSLWPPSKISQHLWPLLINEIPSFGVCSASARGPQRTVP